MFDGNFDGTRLNLNGDANAISAESGPTPIRMRPSTGGIEHPPAPPEVTLEDGMEVTRLKAVCVTAYESGRDVQRAAKCDSEMRKKSRQTPARRSRLSVAVVCSSEEPWRHSMLS